MCANCSEVVRRLVNEAIKHQGDATWLDPTVAETILHSWRERRVQELEEALHQIAAHHFANEHIKNLAKRALE